MQGTASDLAPLPDFNGIARTDPGARASYSEGAGIFRIVPAGVVVPSTTRALAELVGWAADTGTPLIPRGAGSGMVGGNIGRGLVMDLTILDGAPVSVRPGERMAEAGAAVTHRGLSQAAEHHGLRLPPDPSSARFATLGGMLATNASGPHSVRAGSVREWVTALDLITADGVPLRLRRGFPAPDSPAVRRFLRDVAPALEAARDEIGRRFPRTAKNSSGFALDRWLAGRDLIDLFVGSEGTLAVITGAEWRLEAVPVRLAGVRAALRDAAALGRLLPALLEADPSAVEYLDATFLEFAQVREGGEAGLLMVELEGDGSAEIEERLTRVRDILEPHAVGLTSAQGRAALDALWDVRHAASPMLAGLGPGRRSLQVIEDACVPLDAIGRYIAAVRRAGETHRIPLVIFGHAGQGNLHVNLLPDTTDPSWKPRVTALFDSVSEVVISLGGTLSGEHGDGRLRAGMLERVYGPEIVALFRRVKDAFDPGGIFNPGVKLPLPGQESFSDLKVGPEAEGLPPVIEAALREIERSAGYGQFRLELAGPR